YTDCSLCWALGVGGRRCAHSEQWTALLACELLQLDECTLPVSLDLFGSPIALRTRRRKPRHEAVKKCAAPRCECDPRKARGAVAGAATAACARGATAGSA